MKITDAKTDHCALYLGLQGYSFCICLLLNIDCGYSFKPLEGGGSNMYQQSMFLVKIASYCMGNMINIGLHNDSILLND